MPFCRICQISVPHREHYLPLQFCLQPLLCQVWGLNPSVNVRVTFNVQVIFGQWLRLCCWWWGLWSQNNGCPYCCHYCSVNGSKEDSWGQAGWVVVKVRGAGAVVRIEEAEDDPGEASTLLDSSIGINPAIPPSTGPKDWWGVPWWWLPAVPRSPSGSLSCPPVGQELSSSYGCLPASSLLSLWIWVEYLQSPLIWAHLLGIPPS